ncbi:hypothetical protein [Aureimonas glaciei]|uniref:Uncharacterized protein n=1 Tax=Aureimonas glaciei TaxID=1776957 RepID=A0A916Y2U6_9HYPH|nr:hypothetical protein [Aureimonas glaciei]GGD28799.1 hypothetical protein GCM10011335_34960 [Aureimonas glaciei]
MSDAHKTPEDVTHDIELLALATWIPKDAGDSTPSDREIRTISEVLELPVDPSIGE